MANSSADVDSLTSKLQSTFIPKEGGVSFVEKSLKLDNANDAQPIVDEINRSDNVEYLNMEGNSLGVDAAKEIAKALEKRKEFKKALWKDMFTSRLKTEIPIALKHLTGSLMLAGAKLEILDLSDNASGPIGVEGFEEFLRSPSCYSLKELRLNNMGLGITGAKKLASALMDLYNNSKNAGEPLKLEVFIAGRNRLENHGATALAQVFQKIGTLKEISIPQNGIYHVGISALSTAFSENLSLESINLNDNTVTEKGAQSLSKVLGSLTNLKLLDLGDCLLRSKGAIAIAESLSSLRHLESLNLSFNELKGEAGLRVLNSVAPLSACLTSLRMEGNMFGPMMSEELATSAQQLQLPLGSLRCSEDEGDDGDDDDDDDDDQIDEEEVEEEEDDDEEDTESDQPYNIDDRGDEKNIQNVLEVSTDGITLVTTLLESLSVSSALPEESVSKCLSDSGKGDEIKPNGSDHSADTHANEIILEVTESEIIKEDVGTGGISACTNKHDVDLIQNISNIKTEMIEELNGTGLDSNEQKQIIDSTKTDEITEPAVSDQSKNCVIL